MGSVQTIDLLKSLSRNVAHGSCEAAILYPADPEATGLTADLNTAVANTLRLNDGTTNTDFLLTNALYDTMGELADAVNATAKYRMKLLAAKRSWNSYATTIKLITIAATALTKTGVLVLWNSTNSLRLAVAVGPEGDPDVTIAQAKRSKGNMPVIRKASDLYGQTYVESVAAYLGTVSAVATFSAGATTWNIYRSTDAADVLVYTKAGAATTVTDTLDYTLLGLNGLQTALGERLVIEYVGSSANFTAGSISITDAGYGVKG